MRHRFAFLPALVATVFLSGASVPAHAQGRGPGWGTYGVRSEAYNNGYRRGYQKGAEDSRSRRPAEWQRERDYRDADWGYDKRLGSKGEYKRLFRDGFAEGYREGYAERGAVAQRRPLPPVYRYPDARDDRGGYGGYGTYGTYGNRSASQVAFNYGYNDGFERGMKAARDGKRFDPNREGWYRDGDRHYDGDYGSRDQYRASYRDGFLRGYDEGYRGTGYYRQ